MKHIYEIGMNIFCFEPDETKEKLIYCARIISVCGFRVVQRKSVPVYKVHFLGWNKKWDRIVSQDLLLPSNCFNQTLKDKIDKIAKDEEKNHVMRHELIDYLLEIASKVVNQATFDWDSVDDKLMKFRDNVRSSKRIEIVSGDSSDDLKSNERVNEQNVDKPPSDILDGISEVSTFTRENDLIHLTFCPKINLTDNQMVILELDQKLLSKKSYPLLKTVQDINKYSQSPCVLDILQNYLDVVPHCDFKVPGWKEFERFYDTNTDIGVDVADSSAINFLDMCSESGGRRPLKLPLWPDNDLCMSYQAADASTRLCFEICSGLRVIFDSYVRSCLLYEHEWLFHDTMVALCDACAIDQKLKPATSECSVKLVPNQFRNHRFGFQPSLFYGYTHLLRLLYEFPRILTRLSLTRSALTVVLRHCYSLIKYLDTHYKDYIVSDSVSDQSGDDQVVMVPGSRGTRKRSVKPLKEMSKSEDELTRRSLRSGDHPAAVKRKSTCHRRSHRL